MEELNRKIPNLNQNLLQSQTPLPPETTPADASRPWKLIAFDALAIFLAAASGYCCLLYFSGGVYFSVLASMVTLLLIVSFFDFLFTRDRRHRSVSVFLQVIAFFAVFYAVKPAALLAASAILLVFHWLAQTSAHAAMENSLKFRLGAVARAYIKKIFMGFALAGIILYLPQASASNLFIPQPKFQSWYNGITGFAQRFYGGVDFQSSVGAFAEQIARTQLETNSQFRALPPAQQEQAIHMSAQELIATTGKGIGSPLTPEMPLATAFYHYISSMFNNFKNQFGESFRVVWAVGLFVIAWSVGSLLIWLVVALAYLVFEAFAAFNVAHIGGETRTKEIVLLS